MKKIRVLIVEDSTVIRELLLHIIAGDPRLEVAAAVASAEEALRHLDRFAPDVISMDIRLPGMNGFEATQKIMAQRPTPIVVVATDVDCATWKITGNALQAGALAVLEKPIGPHSKNFAASARQLCTQLVIMSQVKVVTRSEMKHRAPHKPPPAIPHPGEYRMLGVVSSTGGPKALAHLFTALGRDFPLPILLTQHISAPFLRGFAEWLQSVCPFSVKIVDRRQLAVRGHVYLGAEDRHLQLGPDYLEAGIGEPVCLQRPSGTVLLESMARSLGRRALGVLLTGMGDDGANGLLSIRQAGGYTIAEDESTAVVYGMPAQAVRLGAACESLPLPAIGPRLSLLTRRQPPIAQASA